MADLTINGSLFIDGILYMNGGTPHYFQSPGMLEAEVITMTTGWGTSERGRCWFNTESLELEMWSGTMRTIIGGCMPFTTGYISSDEAGGTYVYLNAGGEQTVVTISPSNKRWIVNGIWLDLSNMIKDGTVNLYYKIDGTNFRLISANSFVVATDPPGIYINLDCGIDSDFKITYTEGADEGVNRDLVYKVIYTIVEA